MPLLQLRLILSSSSLWSLHRLADNDDRSRSAVVDTESPHHTPAEVISHTSAVNIIIRSRISNYAMFRPDFCSARESRNIVMSIFLDPCVCKLKKVKVARTRLPSVGFRR